MRHRLPLSAAVLRGVLLMVTALAMAATRPAVAQTAEQIDQRLTKVERELRAVQRTVFPGGSNRYFEPEVAVPSDAPAIAAPGVPDAAAVQALSTRVDGLEQQLLQLTGQIEEALLRARRAEEAFAKFQADADYRLAVLEGSVDPNAPTAQLGSTDPAAAPTAAGPATPAPAGEAAPAAAGPEDAAEAAYQAAYAFVPAKAYGDAERALAAFVQEYPRHRRASNAQYWLGRVHMAQQRFDEAALAFVTGYQTWPKGDRAPESLLWLGNALAKRGQTAEACRAYNELDAVFPDVARGRLLEAATQARAAAQCDQ